MQNLSQLVSAVNCCQEKWCLLSVEKWNNYKFDLMSGIGHCDAVFLISILHMIFTETDGQVNQ